MSKQEVTYETEDTTDRFQFYELHIAHIDYCSQVMDECISPAARNWP